MVGEVNKIIYNMLISGRGVFLPEVGSLFIERQGARRISKERLLSPRNVVTYSTQEQAEFRFRLQKPLFWQSRVNLQIRILSVQQT